MNSKIKNYFPVLLLVTGLAAAGLFVFLFAELAEELLQRELQTFDTAIIQWFQLLESPFFTAFMVIITELASVWFLTVLSVLTLLILWMKYKDKWGMLLFVIAIAGGGAITWLLKHLFQRGRPAVDPSIDAIGFSFPSGHSMGSLIFYGFILYLVIRSRLSKKIKLLLAVFAAVLIVLIGSSRIYLSAHFPSDVIAGYLAGGIWLILCLLALEWINWQNQHHIKPVYAMRSWLKSVARYMRRAVSKKARK